MRDSHGKKYCVCNKFMVCQDVKKLWLHRKNCSTHQAWLRDKAKEPKNAVCSNQQSVTEDSVFQEPINSPEDVQGSKSSQQSLTSKTVSYLRTLITDHLREMQFKYCLTQVCFQPSF